MVVTALVDIWQLWLQLELDDLHTQLASSSRPEFWMRRTHGTTAVRHGHCSGDHAAWMQPVAVQFKCLGVHDCMALAQGMSCMEMLLLEDALYPSLIS